jgi:hypothetical protein
MINRDEASLFFRVLRYRFNLSGFLRVPYVNGQLDGAVIKKFDLSPVRSTNQLRNPARHLVISASVDRARW